MSSLPSLILRGILPLVLLAPPLFAGETAGSVEKELTQKWNKIKSLSAKVTIRAESTSVAGTSIIESKGLYERKRSGESLLTRLELKSIRVTRYQERETREETSVTTINDGKYTYALAEQGGRQYASKMSMDEGQQMDMDRLLTYMRELGDIRLLPERTVDGHPAYVLEAVARDSEGPLASIECCFAKSSGVALSMVTKDAKGQSSMTQTWSDIKLNTAIPAERFVFIAPPGVNVLDMAAGD